jgi:GMP synthase (glutamine-hydrolysing)
MKTLIINNTEPADRDFNIPLFKTIEACTEITIVDYQALTSDHINTSLIGGVVLSGVPIFYSAEVIGERAKRLGWLKSAAVPVLGICLGHQSMGVAFGSELFVGYEEERAPITISLTPQGESDFLLNGFSDEINVKSLHTCSISVPDNFNLLASSPTCANQIMKHASLPLYGIQFHPELSQTGADLIKNFVEIAKQPLNVAPELFVA